MKWDTKRKLNRLCSSDVVAIPLLTANLALILEYWVVAIGGLLPFIDTTLWSLVIFHILLGGVLYVNLRWDDIEEKAEEAIEEAD